MKKRVFFLAIFLTVAAVFAQTGADFRQRAMTKNLAHYSTGDGRVASAEYWQLKLGRFEVNVVRRFPGEGDIQVNGTVNMAFMSGGYLEGNGFGSRGRMMTGGEFAVKRGNQYQFIRQEAIDYIFFGGSRVKLLESDVEEDLFIFIESDRNVYQARDFSLALFVHNRGTNELEFSHDIEGITSIAFTNAEAAQRGHAATMAQLER